LQFWDLDFNSEDASRKDTQKDKDDWGSSVQHLGTGDHYGVTDLEWDPSGRYLATSATAWKHTVSLLRLHHAGMRLLTRISWRMDTPSGTLRVKNWRSIFWTDSSSFYGALDHDRC